MPAVSLTLSERELDSATNGLAENNNWASLPPVVSALERLSKLASLRVHSLNYDELPFLSHVPWVTGFGAEGRFDVATDWGPAGQSLTQLHGSVRWATVGSEMIFYNSTARAAVVRNSVGQMSSARGYQDGRIAPYSPMITGLRKADAILDEPYATYFHLFRQQLLSTNRWLIVGYGFGDRHVNAALRSAWVAWQNRTDAGQGSLRVLVVDWANDEVLNREGGMATAGTVLNERLSVLHVAPTNHTADDRRFWPLRFSRGAIKQMRHDLAVSFDGTAGVFDDRDLEKSAVDFLFG